MKKQNMVIGTFFSQFGVALLRRFIGLDSTIEPERGELVVDRNWSGEKFKCISSGFEGYKSELRAGSTELYELRKTMMSERGFLLTLLGNQNLLGHEELTDLLGTPQERDFYVR